MGGGDESQGLDALITIVPPPEVCVETVNWHLRGAGISMPKLRLTLAIADVLNTARVHSAMIMRLNISKPSLAVVNSARRL